MKRHLFMPLLLTCPLLTGCSYSESFLEEKIWERSGVKDDADYQKCQEMLQNSEIDSEGHYLQQESHEEKPIHITFWNDRLLDISYYYDAQLTQPVNTDLCYLDYGESLYASSPHAASGYENYTLTSYRIWDESNKQTEPFTESDPDEQGKLVFTVPKDETITEYSVEPVGSYKKVSFSFSSNHSGVWYVDGEKKEDNTTVGR